MHFLSVASVTIACLFTTVHGLPAATQWFAVFSGNDFLDSNNAKIETTFQEDVGEVDANNDKGERFRFPTGDGGILISQAHENHAVGYDSGKNEFHADFSQSHFDALVTVSLNGNTASFCNNDHCIGAGGRATSEEFLWNIQQISQA